MFKNILVCLDCSKFAEQILPYAYAEAKKFDSKIVLFHVCIKNINGFPALINGQANYIPIEAFLEESVHRCDKAKLYLNKIAVKNESEGIETEVVLLEGVSSDLADIIVLYAKTNNISLIAMASHGRNGLNRFLFGNVTGLVARKSSLPMLTVTPSPKVMNNQHMEKTIQKDRTTLFGVSP
jgi:nucleotide-binding universal stress UspA family protein